MTLAQPWWRRPSGLLRGLGVPGPRSRVLRCGLIASTLLFVLSLGVSFSRMSEHGRLDSRLQADELWVLTQAQVELGRLNLLLQRQGVALEPAIAEQHFGALMSRLHQLGEVGEAAQEMGDHRRSGLLPILEKVWPAEALLRRLLAGDDTAAEPLREAMSTLEAAMNAGTAHLLRDRQDMEAAVSGGLHGLQWTLLGCLFGLGASVGLLVLMLLLESRRARALLAGAEAANRCQRRAERTLRVLIDGLPTMVSAYDLQGRYLFFNGAYTRFHRLEGDGTAIGQRPEALGVEPDISLRGALQGRACPWAEYEVPDGTGQLRTLLATALPVEDDGCGPVQVVHVALDISDRKAVEDRVRHLAEHDPLTDLPNRVFFTARLRQAIAMVRRQEECGDGCTGFALHCIDLDRFKAVNDSLGHQAGDSLLLAAVERMRACLRRGDTLARLGGDEFAVLQADVTSKEDAARLAARLVRVLGLPFLINGCTVHSGASIGSVVAPAHGRSAEELQQRGDIALYRAKAEGRGRAVTFSPEMAAALAERRQLEADLRQALALEGEFFLVYQPKFDLACPTPTGCEALLRWNHPARGLVSPAVFVPITEEAGMAADLSRMVLRMACRQIRAWMDGGREVPVAVNLSALHFTSDQAVTLVEEALRAAGVPARLLEIEVTEGVFIREAAAAQAALKALRALGVRVALDDFGTGYSSLSYLQNLPFDVVKVDRAFVQALRPGYGSGVRIVDAIVRLAHGLGARVVAEGVERPEQLEMLRRLGCDSVQGFLLARPMPAAEVEALFGAGGESAGKVA